MDTSSGSFATELSEDQLALMKMELMPGERLIWATRSPSIPHQLWSELFIVLICSVASIAIGAVCFAFVFGAIGGRIGKAYEDSEPTFAVLGLILGLIGMAGIIGVFVRGIKNARPSHEVSGPTYALTDRRAIIWRPRFADGAVEVFSFNRGSIRSVHRVEFPEGRGSVMFQLAEILPYDTPNGFVGIDDARRVEELVRDTLLSDSAK